MIVYCPDREHCQLNALICVFSCGEKTKISCKVYAENYEKIKSMLIAQRYLTKYGLPNFPLPLSHRPKKEKKASVEKKPKESKVAKVQEPEPTTPKPVATEIKPKRKRRTNAQILFDKAEGK